MDCKRERKEYCCYLNGVAEGLDRAKEDTIKELEKIKERIGIYYADCSLSISENDENCKRCNDNVFDSILMMIDNHISELKGENK